MIFIAILFCLITVGVGFYIGKNPKSISGYNTMSEEQLQKVNLPKIACVLRNALCVAGVITLAATIMFDLLDMAILATLSMILPILISILVALLMIAKYDKATKNAWVAAVIVIVTTVPVLWLIFSGTRSAEVNIDETVIEITGRYGVKLNLDDIAKVELCATMPKIERRTNGLSVGEIRKGKFRLENQDNVTLLLHSKEQPFLFIETKSGKRYYYNSEIEGNTKNVYELLQREMNK